jgi:hypothetical protein
MADDTVQMQDKNGKLWNIPRARVPEAMQRGAKVYSLPSQTTIRPPSGMEKFESDVITGQGLDPAEVKAESGTDFVRNMATGMGQWGASVLKDPFHIADPIEFMSTNLEQALKEKNPGKIIGALSSIAMGMEGMEKGPKLASEAGRPVVRGAIGLGKTGETLERTKVASEASKVAKENEASLREARDAERQAEGKVKEAHEKQVAAAQNTQAQLAERQRLAGESRKHATDLSNGMLQDLRDKAHAEAKDAYGQINGSISSTDLNGDIRSAVNEGLKGSGKTPAILERLLVESSPAKGASTTVRALSDRELQASKMAADILKGGGSASDAKSAMTNLGFIPSQADAIVTVASGVTGEAAGPSYSFEKLHGIYSELGRELYRRDLPGDEYNAIKTARDKVLDRMRNLAKADDPTGTKAAQFEVAQAGYSQFMNTFWNDGPLAKGGSPVAKALATYDTITKKLRPAYVQQILSDSKAHELAQEMLSRYKHLGAPTDILRDMKEKFEASKKPIKVTPAPKTPEMPSSVPINLKETPKFDPKQWRMNEMTRRAQQYVNPSRFEAPISAFGAVRGPFFRAMAELYNNPTFRKWIAGEK